MTVETTPTCSCTEVEDPWCEVHMPQYIFPMWWRCVTATLATIMILWFVITLVGNAPAFIVVWNLVNASLMTYTAYKSWVKC